MYQSFHLTKPFVILVMDAIVIVGKYGKEIRIKHFSYYLCSKIIYLGNRSWPIYIIAIVDDEKKHEKITSLLNISVILLNYLSSYHGTCVRW